MVDVIFRDIVVGMREQLKSGDGTGSNILNRFILSAGCLGAGALMGFVGAEMTEGQSVSSRVLACEEVVRSSEDQALSASEIAPCDGLQMISKRIETFTATDADIKQGVNPSESAVTYELVKPEEFDEIIAQRAAMLEDSKRQVRHNWILGGLFFGALPTLGYGLSIAGRSAFELSSSKTEHKQREQKSRSTGVSQAPAQQGG